MKVNIILFCFGVCLLLTFGCNHEPLYPLSNLSADSLRFKSISCNQDTAYFYNDVGPLIISNCAITGCHDGNSGYNPTLTNYADIVKAVTPGQMDQSKLYNSLVTTGENMMPKAPMAAFNAAQILLIGKWIQQGALNNGCSLGGACNLTNVTYATSAVPILQTSCNACHSATSYASAGGGFRISSHADFLGFAKSGLLMNSINNIGVANRMPKGGSQLSACNIAKLALVVKQIVDSLNLIACDTTNVTFPLTILPIMQSSCLQCHSTANAATLGAGYKLETLTDFTAVAKTGLLMNSINNIGVPNRMPKGGNVLAICDITKIGIFVRSLGGTIVIPPVSSCSPDTVYFTNTLGPLIVSSCAMTGCHNGTGRSPILVTYANIRSQATPGFPTLSRLYNVLGSGGEESMPRPPVAPFTAAQKLLVYKWIQQGAKNNSCVDATCDLTNVTYSATLSSIFSTNCVGCHSSASSSTTKLDSYTGVKASVTAGRLAGAIDHLSGFVAMPPGGSLSVCDINKIKAWITNGALNN